MITETLDQPFDLSADTAAVQSKLAGTISVHNAAAADVEAQIQALQTTAAPDWTPADDAVAVRLRASKIECLQGEISLRGQMEDFFADIASGDYPAAVNAAIQTADDTTADVGAKLAAIGFPAADSNPAIARLIAAHPAVLEANQAVDALRSYDLQTRRNANLAASAKCRGALDTIKAAALAVLNS